LEFRRELLESEGLRYGSAEARALFWRRYNLAHGRRTYRVRKAPSNVGFLTGRLLRYHSASDGARVARARSAWSRAVPAFCHDKCRVDSLNKGELTVIVDAKSTVYVLRRQEYQQLLERLEDAAPGLGIRTIRFRVGNIRRAQT